MMIPSLDDIRSEIAKHFLEKNAQALPLWGINGGPVTNIKGLTQQQSAWLKSSGWKPGPGTCALLPGEQGVGGAVFDWGDNTQTTVKAFTAGILPVILPEGDYYFSTTPSAPELACLSWALGAYSFQRYMSNEKRGPRRLRLPEQVSLNRVLDIAQAVWLARDLINTPSNDCGPAELEEAVRAVAKHFGAECSAIIGDELLQAGFRLHHAVGRASDRAPRLIELNWGPLNAPKLTLVGKGICFDTGGLNIKTGSSMLLMKKDMAGAATALALSAMIMAAKLPVRLRLLIPAADNNISANAFHPGDIIRSRNGMTVEIGNTDAEGRLVLADALSLADEEGPDLLVTFATLTGAARVALGPDLPPFYTYDNELGSALAEASMKVSDPLWRMPFWPPYDSYLKSEVADVANASHNAFAGSLVAALFLKRFVKSARRFLHLDIYGWSPRLLPGKPLGGEPQGARALFEVLARDYGAKT